jgi:hypothetical protein
MRTTKKQKIKSLQGKTLNFTSYGRMNLCVFDVRSYQNGRPALRLLSALDGEPFGTLTVNLPESKVLAGQIIVKVWSENEAMAAAALASGMFRDTGGRIPTGYVEAQVWEVV